MKFKINSKVLTVTVLVICVCTFTFNLGLLVYRCYGYVAAQNEYSNLYSDSIKVSTKEPKAVDESGEILTPTEQDSDSDSYDIPTLRVDFEELSSTNPDVIGWLYIPAIDLSYPIVQSKDNVDYLDKTFNGTKNAAGCIFNDATIKAPFYEKTILYGHNMKDGSMFAKLYNLNQTDDVWVYMPNGAIRHYSITEIRDTNTSDTQVYSIGSNAEELILSTCIKNKERHVVILHRDGTYL